MGKTKKNNLLFGNYSCLRSQNCLSIQLKDFIKLKGIKGQCHSLTVAKGCSKLKLVFFSQKLLHHLKTNGHMKGYRRMGMEI